MLKKFCASAGRLVGLYRDPKRLSLGAALAWAATAALPDDEARRVGRLVAEGHAWAAIRTGGHLDLATVRRQARAYAEQGGATKKAAREAAHAIAAEALSVWRYREQMEVVR